MCRTASAVCVVQLSPCFGSMPLPPLAFDWFQYADTGGDPRGLIKRSNVMQTEGRHDTRDNARLLQLHLSFYLDAPN